MTSSPPFTQQIASNDAIDASLDGSDRNKNTIQKENAIDFRLHTIYHIAKKVVRILGDLGVGCALFGSTACALYGGSRSPNDLDILAFPPEGMTREQIKQAIHDSSRSFHLERSVNPQATYKILYYRFDEIKGPRGFFLGNKCKVDILVPGIMHLPALSPTHIQKLDGLPLLPFSVLMLQKLQAWDDHRNLRWTELKKYAKSAIDARDLQHLLTLTDHVVPLRVSKPWRDLVLFSEEFQNLSFRRARDFCSLFPECKHDFKLLGLPH